MDGTIFPDDISMNLGVQGGHLSMCACTFKGNVSIPSGVITLGLALSGSIFSKGLSIGERGVRTYIDEDANRTMVRSTKKKKEHGVRLEITNDLMLDGVNIEGDLNVKNCSIGGTLRACDLVVKGMTNLASTRVKGDFDLTSATFQGRVQINETEVAGKATIEKTIFDEECRLTQSVFHEGALFCDAIARKQLLIQKTRFEKKVWFEKVQINNASFPLSHFGGKVIFNDVALQTVSLLDAPVEDFCFLGCSWHTHRGRVVTSDLLKLKNPRKYKRIKKDLLQSTPLSGMDIFKSPGSLAELYRRLKKLARTENDELLASDWHYLEKEMLLYQIEADWPRFGGLIALLSKSFLWLVMRLYRLCSGYGESPARALVVLASLIVLTVTIACKVEMSPEVEVDTAIEAAWLLPLSKVTLPNPTWWSYWLKWGTSTLITAQGALFVFALRNKLRR